MHAIESGSHALAALKANIAVLGNPPNLRLHPRPFEQELPRLRGCDLVFADPPFPWFAERPELIAQVLTGAQQALVRTGRLILHIHVVRLDDVTGARSAKTCTRVLDAFRKDGCIVGSWTRCVRRRTCSGKRARTNLIFDGILH